MEECVADFVGKPAAIVFGMGYATNSAILPALIAKLTAPRHLEKVLREEIAKGQPNNPYNPWKKIIVVVEGIYSMEGELCKLPEIVSICKRYKAYVYLDESHSMGVVGKTGRGVCELLGIDASDVDVMMGTFSKSFGPCGGYIAGSKVP
ncbi:serine palmitoyltransferase component [Orobanche minor]